MLRIFEHLLEQVTAATKALGWSVAILVPYAIVIYTLVDLTPTERSERAVGRDFRASTSASSRDPAAMAGGAPLPSHELVVSSIRPKAGSAGEVSSEGPALVMADVAAQPAPPSPPPAAPQPATVVAASPT